MINYLVGTGYAWGMTSFVSEWAPSLGPRVRVLEYPEVFRARSLETGTFVFADLDVIPGRQRAAAADLWKQLEQAGGHVRLLNNPGRMLRRYELLQALNEAGINRFRAYRVEDRKRVERYPVFLKREDVHTGSLSGLLHSTEEVERAIVRAVIRGNPPERLILVEFCDTADANGIYRKFGAFSIGGRIVPRHMFVNTDWMVRAPGTYGAELLAEEREYVFENPHEKELSRIFEIANVDYGRIDYSFLGDSIQVWEINTNPTYLSRTSADPARLALGIQVAETLAEALAELDSVQPGQPIPISIAAAAGAAASVPRRPRRIPAALRRAYVAAEPLMLPARKLYLSRTDRRLRMLR